MGAALFRPDVVELGEPRVVARRLRAQAPARARNWEDVQRRAAAGPQVLNRLTQKIRAGYDAGGISRINAQWGISVGNANRELRFGLANMRARSRDLERNDPFAKKFLELVETNIVGPCGINMQSRAGDLGPAPDFKFTQDKAANSIIEREWAAFSRAGQFDVTGKLSRAATERLLVRAIARDGEVMVKPVADPTSRWGIRYQLLEADWLDEKLNEDLPNGNRIVLGVELDPAGKPVAYHLHTRHPGDAKRVVGSERIRYTADQIRHYFIAERPEQVRGTPWMHAAMSKLYQLGEFDEAAILAARLGADKFMILEDAEGTAADMADGQMPTPDDANAPSINEGTGALYFQSQKGSIDILPRGTKVADWNPNYPSDTYGPFIKAALRGVSSGLPGVSYESLSNDREGVTWTSIRHAVLDEREAWKALQRLIIDTYAWDGFTLWLDAALLSPKKPLAYLPASKRDKFLSPVFTGRRWDWVNPKDDMEAKEKALQMRLTSHRRVLAEQGIDLEELLSEMQDDRELAATYGVDLDAVIKKSAPAAQTPAQPDPGQANNPPVARRPPQNQGANP
jgi:lambda family phage portal protein